MKNPAKVWHVIVAAVVVLVIAVSASAAGQKKGPIGPMGPQGAQGAQGNQGTPGVQGPTGPRGRTGPPLQIRANGVTAPASAKFTIAEGTWHVGTDVRPGTYHAVGGSDCYWETRNTPEGTGDILNNGLGENHPVVTLTSGEWFKTSSCGIWR